MNGPLSIPSRLKRVTNERFVIRVGPDAKHVAFYKG